MTKSGKDGFTLIEVIISLSALLALTIAATVMIRSGIDLRTSLLEVTRVNQRLSRVMERLAKDFEHTLFIPNTDLDRGNLERQFMSVFNIEKDGDSDKIYLTTMAQDPASSRGAASDVEYVIYEIKNSVKITGRKDLYRGSLPFNLKDQKAEPEMRILSNNIKGLHISAWSGDGWSRDAWNASRVDTRNKIPRMVKIDIESWMVDPKPGDGIDATSEANTLTFSTIVFIPTAAAFLELKTPTNSIRWL